MENDKSGIKISWTVLFTVVVPIVAAYGTGVWFMANLTDSVKKQSETQVVFDRRITELGSSLDRRLSADESSTEHRFNTDEDKMGTNKDQIQATTNAINDRLIRMEAQLAYLVKTTSPGR